MKKAIKPSHRWISVGILCLLPLALLLSGCPKRSTAQRSKRANQTTAQSKPAPQQPQKTNAEKLSAAPVTERERRATADASPPQRYDQPGEAQAATEQRAEITQQVAQQMQVLTQTTHALAGLTQTTAAALESQAVLQTSLQQLDQAGWPETLQRVSDATLQQASQLQRSVQALSDLTQLTHGILAAQTTLQHATAQLQQTNFTPTLAALQESLTMLGPILAGFREPFVLQAVPVVHHGQAAD